jgi:glycerol kinase
MVNTGAEPVASRNRLVTTAALGPAGEPCYALEGSVFIAGAAIQWLRDGLRIIRRASDSLALARKSRDGGSVYMVPAFVGLGAPHWDAGARGAIVGITRGTTRADLIRAALDSIAYQVRDVLVAMESDTGREIPVLRVDGGATANPYLMQFQADILGKPVRRPAMLETTALGAAMLAGMATGLWPNSQDLDRLQKGAKVFEPRMHPDERERLIAGWRDAVERVLTRRA